MFSVNSKVQTRCGYKARILVTDLLESKKRLSHILSFPILAAVTCEDEDTGPYEVLHRYRENGCFMNSGAPHHLDLVPIKHEAYFNIYRKKDNEREFTTYQLHTSRAKADRGAMEDRIACVRIEFSEGEGLDDANA